MTRRPKIVRGGRLLDAADWAGEARDILIADGAIAAILPPGAAAPEGAETVDAGDRLIMPGLVNAHTHGDAAFGKGRGDRLSLELLLSHAPFVALPLTLEEIALAAKLTGAELLLRGTTAAYDLFTELPMPTVEGLAAAAEGYAAAGVRMVLAPLMSTRTLWKAVPGLADALTGDMRRAVDAIGRPSVEALADVCATAARGWRWPRDRVRLALGPTIPHHCDDALFTACRALADEYGLAIQTHVGESKVQALAGLTLYGESLTAHLDRLGVVAPDFTAAHAIWLDGDDHARLAERGASVAHNPVSNLRLGTGVAPTAAMRRAGIAVGIGTDANTCADALNMFEAMRMAAYVSRISSFDPDDWLGAGDVLAMATTDSARVLGLDAPLGRIAEGFRADLVFLDLSHIGYIPLGEVRRQVVYTETGAAIRRVMVGGETVVEDGRLLTLDLSALRREAEAAAGRHRAFARENAALVERLGAEVSRYCVGLCRTPHHVHRIVGESAGQE